MFIMPMIQIKNKLTNDEIDRMPIVAFAGNIYVISTETEAQKAVAYLAEQGVVGIDTETRPNFQPRAMNPVALLQVATLDICFLFRLNQLGLPSCVLQFLESPVIKVGLSLRDDLMQLRRRHNLDTQHANWVDLQQLAPRYGILEMGLKKIYAMLFSEKISKRQQLTNWEASTLTEAQQRYAATDAWACLRIYNYLNQFVPDQYTITLYEQNISEA